MNNCKRVHFLRKKNHRFPQAGYRPVILYLFLLLSAVGIQSNKCEVCNFILCCFRCKL